jgi:hypothetical protein
MFIIILFIIIIVTVLIGMPLISRLTLPFKNRGNKKILIALKSSLWAMLILLVTWPITVGPALFELQCRFATEVQLSSAIDARGNGYFDERLSIPHHIKTHVDFMFFNRDVEDLISGRIAFFESKNLSSSDTDIWPYLRYYLDENTSVTCNKFGLRASPQVKFPEGKCLASAKVDKLKSKYLVSVSGDINIGNGASSFEEISSKRNLAIYRSFARTSFPYGGTSHCPSVRVKNDDYSAHIAFTSIILKDAFGNMKQIER